MAIHAPKGHLFILWPQNTSTQDPRAAAVSYRAQLTGPDSALPIPALPAWPALSSHVSAYGRSVRYVRAALRLVPGHSCPRPLLSEPPPRVCFLRAWPSHRAPPQQLPLLCSPPSPLPGALPSTARCLSPSEEPVWWEHVKKRRLGGREAVSGFPRSAGKVRFSQASQHPRLRPQPFPTRPFRGSMEAESRPSVAQLSF